MNKSDYDPYEFLSIKNPTMFKVLLILSFIALYACLSTTKASQENMSSEQKIDAAITMLNEIKSNIGKMGHNVNFDAVQTGDDMQILISFIAKK